MKVKHIVLLIFDWSKKMSKDLIDYDLDEEDNKSSKNYKKPTDALDEMSTSEDLDNLLSSKQASYDDDYSVEDLYISK
jgi:hypothetical protein